MPESSPSPPKILPAALCCGMNMFCLGVSFPGTTCSPCYAAIICSCMGVIAAPPALDAAAPSMNGGSPAPWRGAVSAGGSSGPMNPAIRLVEWIAAVIFVVKVCSSSVFFLASSTALALASAVSNFSFCLFHAAQLGPELGPESLRSSLRSTTSCCTSRCRSSSLSSICSVPWCASGAVTVVSLRASVGRRWAPSASSKVLGEKGYGMMWE